MAPILQYLSSILPTLGVMSSLARGKSLPIVDLGYVRQQATKLDDAKAIYTFSNIRYARAPVGDLRFAPPHTPDFEPTMQTGKADRICFQAQPAWQMTVLGPWVEAWVGNDTAKFYKEFPNPPKLPSFPSNLSDLFPSLLPEETEDCLFLDVHVPKEVYDRREAEDVNTRGAAILLWIHGGGLTLGSKVADTDFKGLLSRSREGSEGPVIVVSINYRLGAFGWLGGPAFRKDGGTSNVGLLDQRFAMEWIQKYVHLFGGDPRRVTVAGESAGGASIVHHITARGGLDGPPPFQQALVQSGGWNPITNASHLERMYRDFLKVLCVGNLKAARCLPSMTIRNASFLLTFILRWGELGFGVEPDGDYVLEAPAKLLLEGRFHHNLNVMVGQNAAEGVLFTSPWITDDQKTRSFISDSLPTASDAQISYLSKSLYPPNFAGSNPFPYKSYLERAQFFVSEAGVYCNSDFLGRAFHGRMYNYLFSVPPALHADDLAYTFYDGSDPSTDENIARTFQGYLLNFLRTGDPNGCGMVKFEEYGKIAWTMDVGEGGFSRTEGPGANERCRWWQERFY